MNWVILFFGGFIFMVIGFTFCILYFNLFVFGYSLFDYLLFLLSRWECYFFVVGVVLVIISLVRKEKKV